jgi:hypothetical protein
MNKLHRLLAGAALMALSFAAIPSGALLASDQGTRTSNTPSSIFACPTTSGNSYQAGVMYQYDTDNPVRPDDHHADKNLKMRSYEALPDQSWGFYNYGPSHDPGQPPQFATIFNPARVPVFSTAYQVHEWIWGPNSNTDGTRGPLIDEYDVTALGLQTTPGEPLKTPIQGRDLGDPWGRGAALIYADSDSIALKYTREDSAATGYTVHIQNICTDPNLLALYDSLNSPTGPRYRYPRNSYNLAGLTAGQVFGTARGDEIVVAIVDTGRFQDPRALNDWWRIRPAAPDLSAPILNSPSNGAAFADTTIGLAWTAGSYSNSFQIQVSQDSGFGSTELNQTQPGTSLTTPALADGRHYWRVRGYNASNNAGTWSPVWSFVTDGMAPNAPVLSSPRNGSLAKSGAVKLSTKKAGDAVTFEFQVAEDDGFGSIVFEDTLNKPTVTVSPALDFGTYFWRARASDAAGNTSGWSSPFSFSYTLMSKPKNGLTTRDTTPTFSWKPLKGALGYEIRITDGGGYDETFAASSAKLTPTVPLGAGLYQWQVRVNTTAGWSAWMPLWTVTVQP